MAAGEGREQEPLIQHRDSELATPRAIPPPHIAAGVLEQQMAAGGNTAVGRTNGTSVNRNHFAALIAPASKVKVEVEPPPIVELSEHERALVLQPQILEDSTNEDDVVLLARIRPVEGVQEKQLRNNAWCWKDIEFRAHDDTGQATLTVSGKDNEITQYTFKRVFTPDTKSAQIFQTLAPFFNAYAAGERNMVIADGISDAGKTYTLMKGPNALISATIVWVLQQRREAQQPSTIKVRATQFYQNKKSDLITMVTRHFASTQGKKIRPNEQRQKELREASEKEIIKGRLTHGEAWTLNTRDPKPKTRAIELCHNIDLVRQGRETNANARSSRSHTIIEITEDGHQGSFVFVDLCGSEDHDASQGAAMPEWQQICLDREGVRVELENIGKESYQNIYKARPAVKAVKDSLRPEEGKLRLAYIAHLKPGHGEACSKLLRVVAKLGRPVAGGHSTRQSSITSFRNGRRRSGPAPNVSDLDRAASADEATLAGR